MVSIPVDTAAVELCMLDMRCRESPYSKMYTLESANLFAKCGGLLPKRFVADSLASKYLET